jgi:TatD DNase family protein
LLRHPEAGVGEVGLDRWIERPDVPLQMQFFKAQLDLAHELERPLSIHCLLAWGLMQETLAAAKLPRCGFLLHSYGGSAELVPSFVKRGAYFSVSPYFFHPRKAAQLEVFRQVPLDRLLLETDAPDMWPPEDSDALKLSDPKGQTLNDPRNIAWIYERVAALRQIDQEELAQQVEENFCRLFGR